MSQRKYSVAEIDAMRNAIAYMSWRNDPDDTERRLRTYMLNGTDPEELLAPAEEKYLKDGYPANHSPFKVGG